MIVCVETVVIVCVVIVCVVIVCLTFMECVLCFWCVIFVGMVVILGTVTWVCDFVFQCVVSHFLF